MIWWASAAWLVLPALSIISMTGVVLLLRSAFNIAKTKSHHPKAMQ